MYIFSFILLEHCGSIKCLIFPFKLSWESQVTQARHRPRASNDLFPWETPLRREIKKPVSHPPVMCLSGLPCSWEPHEYISSNPASVTSCWQLGNQSHGSISPRKSQMLQSRASFPLSGFTSPWLSASLFIPLTGEAKACISFQPKWISQPAAEKLQSTRNHYLIFLGEKLKLLWSKIVLTSKTLFPFCPHRMGGVHYPQSLSKALSVLGTLLYRFCLASSDLTLSAEYQSQNIKASAIPSSPSQP